MKTDSTSPDSAANDEVRRAAVANFIDSLKCRRHGLEAQSALPEQLEAVVRQVDAAAGGLSADDLAACLAQTASVIGATVHQTTSAHWLDVVAELVQKLRAKSVLIPPIGDGFFDADRAQQLARRLAALPVTVSDTARGNTLFAAGAAITGVVAAIAETGTIVCESGANVARASSLVPLVHIAVVAMWQLLPDLYDYFETLGRRSEPPANVNMITGPSKTADIEGVLVTGVHGPSELHIVLVGK